MLQSAVTVNVSMALRNAAQALGGVAFLFYTSPLLTALMLAALPGVALGAVVYGRRMRRLARDVQDALAGAGEVAEESIAGLRTVRSFAAEKNEAERYGARHRAGVRAGPAAHPRGRRLHGGGLLRGLRRGGAGVLVRRALVAARRDDRRRRSPPSSSTR